MVINQKSDIPKAYKSMTTFERAQVEKEYMKLLRQNQIVKKQSESPFKKQQSLMNCLSTSEIKKTLSKPRRDFVEMTQTLIL